MGEARGARGVLGEIIQAIATAVQQVTGEVSPAETTVGRAGVMAEIAIRLLHGKAALEMHVGNGTISTVIQLLRIDMSIGCPTNDGQSLVSLLSKVSNMVIMSAALSIVAVYLPAGMKSKCGMEEGQLNTIESILIQTNHLYPLLEAILRKSCWKLRR